MNFKDYLQEENELFENAGNLKGLPKTFIKMLTSTSAVGVGQTGSGLAGKNSNLKLYKANAKQKDLTAAIKSISGMDFLPKDKKSKSYSFKNTPAEEAAAIAKKQNAGVAVKINGQWAYLAFVDYSNKYSLISPEGKYEKKKAVMRTRYRTTSYDSRELTATDLSRFINFGEDNVEVYIITSDANRIQKRLEKAEQREEENGYVPEYKKQALIKFLNSKSNNMVTDAQKDLENQLEDIMNKVKKYYDSALSGKRYDDSFNSEEVGKNLMASLKNIKSIGYVVSTIIDDGTVKEYDILRSSNEDTWAWKRFKQIVSDMEKETKE